LRGRVLLAEPPEAGEGQFRWPLTRLALAGACLDVSSWAGKGGFGVRARSISGRLAVRRGLLACGFSGQGLSMRGSGSP
jgi:hypothetical protein